MIPEAASRSPAERVRVKVCGITRPADALLAAALGADYLGLNFYRLSPRRVSGEQAREIAIAVRAAAPAVELVGVFVNQPAAEIEEIAAAVGLDRLQFSGDEGPERMRAVAGRAIKAFRTGGPPAATELAAFDGVWAVLLDAPHERLYGGTGVGWDYAAVVSGRSPLSGSMSWRSPSAGSLGPLAGWRFFLAGGLGPANVRRAMAAVRPFAVDVCSAVESAPGIKDPELLRRLFEEVRHGEA